MQGLKKNTKNSLDREKNKYDLFVTTSGELVAEEYKNKENKIFWTYKTA